MVGLCYNTVCLDPEADSDGDGLVNALEVLWGSDPFAADSDGDGILDAEEVDSGLVLRDSDGDGKPDILQSRVLDSDGDCIPDELDPDDASLATKEELYAFRADVCGQLGVCESGLTYLEVTCEAGRALCDYSKIPNYEATESTCDGLDNDCDGETDEGCSAPGLDPDLDGIYSDEDNCPEVYNPEQTDSDGNGIGDACEALAPPQLESLKLTSLDEETAQFEIRLDFEEGSTTHLSLASDCSTTLTSRVEQPHLATPIEVSRQQTATLYGYASKGALSSSCVALKPLFGPIEVWIEDPWSTEVVRPLQFHGPQGEPLFWGYTQSSGLLIWEEGVHGVTFSLIEGNANMPSLRTGEFAPCDQVVQLGPLELGEP